MDYWRIPLAYKEAMIKKSWIEMYKGDWHWRMFAMVGEKILFV